MGSKEAENQEQPTSEAILTRYCMRCHRKLRNPNSMKIGYGPVCAKASGIAAPKIKTRKQAEKILDQADEQEAGVQWL